MLRVRDQMPDEIRSDEAGPAGDDDFHGATIQFCKQ
jgi:hypothetical protein